MSFNVFFSTPDLWALAYKVNINFFKWSFLFSHVTQYLLEYSIFWIFFRVGEGMDI